MILFFISWLVFFTIQVTPWFLGKISNTFHSWIMSTKKFPKNLRVVRNHLSLLLPNISLIFLGIDRGFNWKLVVFQFLFLSASVLIVFVSNATGNNFKFQI